MTPASFSVRAANLVLVWTDGEVVLDANLLRANCRCAGCRHAEISGAAIAHEPVLLQAVTPMGYGLQLHFSDGHNRGIFPWRHLRDIANKTQH